jgi:putative ABC transport system permease protein
MKFWPLLWGSLRRRKARSVFTLLSILVAFVLFSYLAAVKVAFSAGVDVAGADRLLTTHKVSIIQPLPAKYKEEIARVPGVVAVTHATWFGGIYQDPSKGFQGIFQGPIEPAEYLVMYPEIKVSDEEKRAWMEDREGVLVGITTAKRYGWKVGDRVPIQGTFWRKKDGGKVWEFNVRGIYTGDKGTDTTQFLFHYDYFDEARQYGQGIVGWYILRISDPAQSAAVGKKIDALFENSPAETKTVTEKALAQGFADQIGNIGAIIQWILTAVFFTLLLVTGNTIAQSVRERTAELAVLKTVGFSDGGTLALVLAESSLLAVIGGGLGLTLGWMAIAAGDPTGGFLPIFYFPSRDLILGVILVVLLGLVAGILPAIQAMRLSIVDALRRA